MKKIETINKVYALLKDIKLRCDKNLEFSPEKLCREHKTSSNMFRMAIKNGYFTKTGKLKYKCNLTEITKEITEQCIEEFNRSVNGPKDKPVLKKALEQAMPDNDLIKKPEYYTSDLPFEAIEIIKKVFGNEKTKSFLEISAFQYRLRMGKKAGVPIEVDFAKEQQCLKMAKELI